MAKPRQTMFTDKAVWNHIGFHRRNVWVNVYTNNRGDIICYTCHDKKKQAVKHHNKAFANTHLKCFRLRVGPSNWRPTALWKHRYPPDQHVEIAE